MRTRNSRPRCSLTRAIALFQLGALMSVAGLAAQAHAAGCAPCSIFGSSPRHAPAGSSETRGISVGVKFTSDVAGTVSGIRFYKARGNTGLHVGALWNQSGHLLRTAAVARETAFGWQRATFSRPVRIKAHVVYEASYFAPHGRYSFTRGGLRRAVSSPPLHALRAGASGSDGVYAYGATSRFPDLGNNATNYWVDVLFTPTPPRPRGGPPGPPTGLTPPPGVLPPGTLAVHVAGNHLVDAAGATIALHGADVSGTEYVCAQNWSADPYGGTPLGSVATFDAMAAWGMNVVRIPLNEDCWLNINGVEVGGDAYQSAIQAEVTAAHLAGMVVILDLHWSAPGTQRALSQNPAPDQDHSPAFWTQVATAYKSDPGVIFDLYNEPFDYWGTNQDAWAGWLTGDTQTKYMTGGSPDTISASWQTAGMQQLVNVIRATGATQPILVNGLDWANDDSGWLAHAPTDPLHQIIAGAHIYPGQSCSASSCWDGVFPAIEASYPVLIGETGDSSAGPVTFLPTLLPYADQHGWSYLAWTWNPWGAGSNVLITDWSGTPTAGEGAAYKAHLATLPPSATP